ncbi:MAG: N-acetylmuramoyl-L-alanine amidase [Gammaproteobacteria bacterium]|nr:N-acetylmuramoyl-L-alanine amidase [Gammaproteobacteria bacterium]
MSLSIKKPITFFVTAILCSLFADVAHSKSILKDVRINQSDDETRLVIDLTEKVKYKLFTLNRPDRIVIDLYQTDLAKGLKTKIKKSGLVNEIRIARNNATRVRMVIETSEILFYQLSAIPKNKNPNHRLVIDLKKAFEGSKKLAASSVNRKKFIVAIDPGHGGKDPGAQGSQVIEKNLVLKISKKLKKLIDNEKTMSAFLIRDNDSFPCPGNRSNCRQQESLSERLNRAKKGGADLLISIHADAFSDSSVRGATLYALSDSRKIRRGSDYKVMYRPKTNNNIRFKSTSTNKSLSRISSGDLDTQDQSIEIGKHILKEMKKDVRIRKKTPREAEFAVLKSTSVASVLIETSYLSNKDDEKFLINPRNQDKIAEAIVRGLKSYSASTRKELGKR